MIKNWLMNLTVFNNKSGEISIITDIVTGKSLDEAIADYYEKYLPTYSEIIGVSKIKTDVDKE